MELQLIINKIWHQYEIIDFFGVFFLYCLRLLLSLYPNCGHIIAAMVRGGKEVRTYET